MLYGRDDEPSRPADSAEGKRPPRAAAPGTEKPVNPKSKTPYNPAEAPEGSSPDPILDRGGLSLGGGHAAEAPRRREGGKPTPPAPADRGVLAPESEVHSLSGLPTTERFTAPTSTDSGATPPETPATAGEALPSHQTIDPVFRPDLESFSGPFELLLYLIHKDEVDIFDIPIAGILKQFLQHVRDLEASGKLDLQESGEYLVMAARLMEIKSRMLLPDDAEEEEDLLEAETEDPRWSLVQQLLEFSVIKQRAELLERAHRSRSLAYERLPGDLPPPEPGSLELRETSTLDLRAAFQRVLDLLRERDAVRVVPGEEIPIEVAMAGIRDQLLEADNRRQPFSTLFPRDLGLRGLISYFMALLELTRLRHLQLEQNDDFGDILVILREAA